MSFDEKNQEIHKQNEHEKNSSITGDFDELSSIKSHLDHSLDINEISVSEELIQKTLQAVKDAQEYNKSADKKQIPWNKYFRRIAGVAAAFVVLAVGYGLLGSSKYDGAKSDSGMPERTIAENGAMANDDKKSGLYSKDNSYDMNDQAKASGEKGLQSQGPGDSSDADNGVLESSNGGSDDNDSFVREEDKTSEKALALKDIFVTSSAKAEYIRITDIKSDKSILIKEKSEKKNFYDILNKFAYTPDSKEGNDEIYLIEVKSSEPEGQTYMMNIGQGISVSTKADTTLNHKTYSVNDSETLIHDLKEFISEYK